MVTSATYRQDSNHPTAEQADPANTWFARATVQRMDAEQMRDSLLAASGELNLKPVARAKTAHARYGARCI